MVLANAMEPLRDLQHRLGIDTLSWKTTTIDGKPALSSSGLNIIPDNAFADIEDHDVLILVAGYNAREFVGPRVNRMILNRIRKCELVIALDTASWLLASTGVLDNQRAAIHWQEIDAFSEEFPNIIVTRKIYVRSGPFLTCGGAASTLELMLDLIRDLYGATLSFEVSTMFVYSPKRKADTIQHNTVKALGSPTLLKAIDAMVLNIEQPISITRIADLASTSTRTINRIFKTELDTTPNKYYQLIRLRRARELTEETDFSIEQIALRCGYSNTSALSRAHAKEFDGKISHLRNH
jgi:transcriptional regulator GlxA family with amidase domain